VSRTNLVEFNKKTIYECYEMIYAKGIFYTLDYYKNFEKEIPLKGQYLHVKPGYKKLIQFLREIAGGAEDDKHLRREVVGEGSINEGEYWGTFIDYFMQDSYYAEKFNKLMQETPFSTAPRAVFTTSPK